MPTMPVPRLPDPLTPEAIEELMKARPYWDTSHPRSPIYRRLVQRGFEIMYPGPLRRDAIRRQLSRTSPKFTAFAPSTRPRVLAKPRLVVASDS
ncbi:MAG: hypothetical protein EXR02_00305 [Rhodospirillales bacterium]|nr:hypothetical protein [Rhodospirillales bacterium]MSP79500.1 hypothetical protein [Rhodospirillales bacterium]